jgi:hypothetical protein
MQHTFSWNRPVRGIEEAECIGYELEICRQQKPRKLSSGKSIKPNTERKDVVVLKKTLRASDLMFNWKSTNILGDMVIRIRSIGGGGSGHGIWSECNPFVIVESSVGTAKETDVALHRDAAMPEATEEKSSASQGAYLSRSRQIPAMKTVIAKKRKPKTWVSLLANATGINESNIIVLAVITLIAASIWMFILYVL